MPEGTAVAEGPAEPEGAVKMSGERWTWSGGVWRAPWVATTVGPGDGGEAVNRPTNPWPWNSRTPASKAAKAAATLGCVGHHLLIARTSPAEQDAGDEEHAHRRDGDDNQIDEIVDAKGNVLPGERRHHGLALKVD